MPDLAQLPREPAEQEPRPMEDLQRGRAGKCLRDRGEQNHPPQQNNEPVPREAWKSG